MCGMYVHQQDSTLSKNITKMQQTVHVSRQTSVYVNIKITKKKSC